MTGTATLRTSDLPTITINKVKIKNFRKKQHSGKYNINTPL